MQFFQIALTKWFLLCPACLGRIMAYESTGVHSCTNDRCDFTLSGDRSTGDIVKNIRRAYKDHQKVCVNPFLDVLNQENYIEISCDECDYKNYIHPGN